jgi:hypothetical protein
MALVSTCGIRIARDARGAQGAKAVAHEWDMELTKQNLGWEKERES